MRRFVGARCCNSKKVKDILEFYQPSDKSMWQSVVYTWKLNLKTMIFSDFWGTEVVGRSLYQKSIWLELIHFHMPVLR